jgi:uncharacterized RDD family membrane protein YckC
MSVVASGGGAGAAAMPVAAGGVRYAGFWIRFIAYVIDSAVLGIVLTPVYIGLMVAMGVTSSLANSQSPDAAVASMMTILPIMVLLEFGAIWVYFAFMESSSKQGTLGKMVLGLKVVDTNYQRISLGRATGRWAGKLISGMILAIGYIMAGFTERKQALHDMIAGTYVIHSK